MAHGVDRLRCIVLVHRRRKRATQHDRPANYRPFGRRG
jgi:hypothetical protein